MKVHTMTKVIPVIVGLLTSGMLMPDGMATDQLPDQASDMVNARYETTQCAHPCKQNSHFQWWLMREPAQVEIRHLYQSGEPAHHSGVWQQKPANQLAYSYLMHEDQRSLDYMDVDLKLLGMKTDLETWQVKSQLVTDQELARLEKAAQTATNPFGYVVETYRGTQADGTQVEIAWMPALKLPQAIHYRYPQHDVTIELQVLQVGAGKQQPSMPDAATPPKTTAATWIHYQHVDYTDIGDMEHNAEDVQWLARAHGAPGVDKPHAH